MPPVAYIAIARKAPSARSMTVIVANGGAGTLPADHSSASGEREVADREPDEGRQRRRRGRRAWRQRTRP